MNIMYDNNVVMDFQLIFILSQKEHFLITIKPLILWLHLLAMQPSFHISFSSIIFNGALRRVQT